MLQIWGVLLKLHPLSLCVSAVSCSNETGDVCQLMQQHRLSQVRRLVLALNYFCLPPPPTLTHTHTHKSTQHSLLPIPLPLSQSMKLDKKSVVWQVCRVCQRSIAGGSRLIMFRVSSEAHGLLFWVRAHILVDVLCVSAKVPELSLPF